MMMKKKNVLHYAYSDSFDVDAYSTYKTIPSSIPDERYKDCEFSITLFNESSTETIYIKFGNFKLTLYPKTSVTLDNLNYDDVSATLYAYATGFAKLTIVVIGNEYIYEGKIFDNEDIIILNRDEYEIRKPDSA